MVGVAGHADRAADSPRDARRRARDRVPVGRARRISLRGEQHPPVQIYGNALLDLPARWDTGWYLTIANEGYSYSAANPNAQQNIAFFPAFPLIVRYLSVIFGRQPLWTGVAVSLVAFFWALVYFLRLARTHLQDEEQAVTAVLLLAAYPFALFFSAAYTEALFLLTLVGAVYHFRRNELWQAAGWGLLAGLTRPNGAFLSVVLGLMTLEIFLREWRRTPGERDAGPPFRWGAHLDRLATASAPGIGMLVYSTFILFLTGHPFQWTAQNAAWGRVYRSLDTLVTDRIDFVTENGVYALHVDARRSTCSTWSACCSSSGRCGRSIAASACRMRCCCSSTCCRRWPPAGCCRSAG